MEIACARLPGAARSAATTAPMPKNVPCGRPDTNRAASSSPCVDAKAEKRFPAVNSRSMLSSRDLRRVRLPRTVSSGAPITTPSAYSET